MAPRRKKGKISETYFSFPRNMPSPVRRKIDPMIVNNTAAAVVLRGGKERRCSKGVALNLSGLNSLRGADDRMRDPACIFPVQLVTGNLTRDLNGID